MLAVKLLSHCLLSIVNEALEPLPGKPSDVDHEGRVV